MTAPHKQILIFNTTPNWKEKKENLLEKIVGSKAGEKKFLVTWNICGTRK